MSVTHVLFSIADDSRRLTRKISTPARHRIVQEVFAKLYEHLFGCIQPGLTGSGQPVSTGCTERFHRSIKRLIEQPESAENTLPDEIRLDEFAERLSSALMPRKIAAAFGSSVAFTILPTEQYAVSAMNQLSRTFPSPPSKSNEVSANISEYREVLRSKDFIKDFCDRMTGHTSAFRREVWNDLYKLCMKVPVAFPTPRSDRHTGSAYRMRATRSPTGRFALVARAFEARLSHSITLWQSIHIHDRSMRVLHCPMIH